MPGEPELHWKAGYYAKSLAYGGEESHGLPAKIGFAVKRSVGSLVEPLIVIPEHKVAMPGSSFDPSQNDVFMLCRTGDGSALVMIEGIVNESVEETAREWLGPNRSSGKKTRIEAVCDMFSLDRKQYSGLRYQPFHRCASAFLEANRFCAAGAVMRVHSFSRENR